MIHYMTTNGVGNAWVANELRVVARAGIPFRLHALARPAATFFTSDDVARLDRETNTLYPMSPARSLVAGLLAPLRFRRRFIAALWNAATGERESLRVRAAGLWHFLVACLWAAEMRGEDVKLIHSQWIHSGGTVAMYGAWLLDKPFSFTGHAADLYRERAALRDKIKRASFIVCISNFHREFFLANGARPEQLQIAYCGIDTSVFTPVTRERKAGEPFRIVSSGRLVEKKGFEWLIRACALLRDRGLSFSCTIAGSGPLEGALKTQIAEAGLDGIVTVTGKALKQEEIPAFMRDGDAYCLPCVWASDGDVDGLPQMLMEAMACGLPAVSTRLVGIPDLIISEQTGLIVEPCEAEPLADALQRLEQDRDLARRLSEQGRKHLLDQFDLATCLTPLLNRFQAHLEAP
jgi:colanic acid/amylovoran biosynthesis glycosyltransferase